MFYPRTSAAKAISGLANTSKVYKGYHSYEDAHSAWNGFVSTGRLPIDVAVSLGSRPYPTPPITLTSPCVLSPLTTSQRIHEAPPLISPGRSVATPGSFGLASPHTPTRAGNHLNHDAIHHIVSPSHLSAPSTPSRIAATLRIVQEEAL
jgi:hypothetical protein